MLRKKGNTYEVQASLPTPQTRRLKALEEKTGLNQADLLRRLFDLGLPNIVATMEENPKGGKRLRRISMFLALTQNKRLLNILRRSRLAKSEALSRILEAGLDEYERTGKWPVGYKSQKD